MDTLANMKTFVAAVNCGGFSDAARRLHVVLSVAAKGRSAKPMPLMADWATLRL
jgi:hypothetical protein